MNTRSITSPIAHANIYDRQDPASEPYASAALSASVMSSGAQYRRDRIDAADMITTDEAAGLAGTSRVTINSWIKSHRCIGVSNLRRGFKLPRWQFEPNVWPVLQPLGIALGATTGWQVLAFLETPALALNGQTPRAALEQGVQAQRILALATAEAH
ncbi:MAG: hypothetical protein KKB95_01535 [Gammaproteobacteria bacterium]|nr:hypothetical protein [Gammaproteobacteria bacterium]MBU1504556.1 hypothetical protein [Gammaproteobacteria bacterium]MBU2119418.1 hypothetical protein [Gammaproteobacteria bacterium]MBU2202815.1 hypothetical protein [Gammaproteobacteria bacterium]MBU2272554.1 hypothetical protein [Gammaproteobacteria bacterium]